MWTVSAFQQHPNTMIIVDEVTNFMWSLPDDLYKDATLELRVRTVKYFKDMWQVPDSMMTLTVPLLLRSMPTSTSCLTRR